MTTSVLNKLQESRDFCPGLSENVYSIADAIVKNAMEWFTDISMPRILGFEFCTATRAIYGDPKAVPDEVSEGFMQLIDAITTDDFSTEFRQLCKEIIGIDAPKRESVKLKCIEKATQWWTNALASVGGIEDNDKLKMFAQSLGELIINKMKESSTGVCEISVDYHPDALLHAAAKEAGIDDEFDMVFPLKTKMRVSIHEVSVSQGYGATSQVIWHKG